MARTGGAFGGAILGALLGYPISYYFQAGMVRAKLSLGDYVKHIGDVLGNKELAPTAIGVWVGAVVALALVGAMLGGMTGKQAPG